MQNGTREQHDAIIVGGGLAGLAAATYLARAGRSVTVLERSSQLGGRAITNDLGGFLFNLGPHAVYRKGAGAKVLRDLGVDYQGHVPSASGYAIRGGALRFLSQNPVSFLASRSLSARAKLALTRFQVRIATIDPAKVRHLTARQWLEREVPQPEARAIAGALARIATYSNDPELSAEVAAMQLKLALRGVLYLDGGWQTLVDGLRAAAERAGARIETGAAVERIEHNGAVRAVRLKDGRSLAARAVIVAGGPDTVAQLVESAAARSWAAGAVPVRAACLDVGLRKLPRPERGFAFGLDEPLYFSVHTRVARLAPEGCVAIHVAKYLAPDDIDAKKHEQELESCLDLVQPGWRDELVQRRYLPNMTVVNAAVHAGRDGLAGRPGPELPGIENLYVAGDWVGPEGWLSDASLASAKRAAELILQKPPAMIARDSAPAGVA
jgi:phytoene dehydrogenase-like protein